MLTNHQIDAIRILQQKEVKMPRSISLEKVENRIFQIRGKKVMIDSDLAELYGVATKALNQATKRNKERFPIDFMFRLTKPEKKKVVTNCDHLKLLKFSPQLPCAFTEQGVAMLSSILNSKRAIVVNIQIMRAFVNLRREALGYSGLKRRIEAIERKYDGQFKIVFEAIKRLLEPLPKVGKKRKIGFHSN